VPVRWTAAELPAAAAHLAASGIASPVAELLALRGVRRAEEAERFLAPRLEELEHAPPLPGVPELAAMLARLAARGGKVTIVGDYDVDGVCSTAILAAAFEAVGGRATTLLPRRDEEGYGLQPLHVRRAMAAGAEALVAVDSGTNAVEAHAEARASGLPLAVVDHHLPEADPDDDLLLVNPRVAPGEAAFEDLTAAGLALFVAAQLLREAGREVPWEALLRLACLGTIADVAPLRAANRTLVSLGLAALPRTRSPGLRALLGRCSLSSPPRAAEIAFRVAPRINAAGRLAAADEALELLTTRDRRRAEELAALLERRNAERQRIEEGIVAAARRRAEGSEAGIFVAWDDAWHRGVVGIAAARLARELHRPVILLALEGERATGSGRSVAGLDLHALVAPFAVRAERFGGHAQAIGLTVAAGELEALRGELEAAAADWLPRLSVREQRFDFELDPSALGTGLLADLETLEPFGAGNPEPVFLLPRMALAGGLREFGRGHLEMAVCGAGRPPLPAVGWRWASRAEELRGGGALDLLAAIERDRRREPRLRLIDARRSAPASD